MCSASVEEDREHPGSRSVGGLTETKPNLILSLCSAHQTQTCDMSHTFCLGGVHVLLHLLSVCINFDE